MVLVIIVIGKVRRHENVSFGEVPDSFLKNVVAYKRENKFFDIVSQTTHHSYLNQAASRRSRIPSAKTRLWELITPMPEC